MRTPGNAPQSSNAILSDQIAEVRRMTGIRCEILPAVSERRRGCYDLYVGVPGGTRLQGLDHGQVWWALWTVAATHRWMTRDEKSREEREVCTCTTSDTGTTYSHWCVVHG